jgi:hypothetical protein
MRADVADGHAPDTDEKRAAEAAWDVVLMDAARAHPLPQGFTFGKRTGPAAFWSLR